MSQALELVKLIKANREADQELMRVPEPSKTTDSIQSVEDYSRVLGSKMSANYLAALELIYRISVKPRRRALDLCCGPGLFALLLIKHLNVEHVMGLDLSGRMIEKARRNVEMLGVSERAGFSVGNCCDLGNLETQLFDLVTCTNAVHHFETLNDVKILLREASRVVKTDGLVLITDVARLKTKEITDRFVELAGEEYRNLAMHSMLEDFKHSMFAAWTPDELRTAIPAEPGRAWVHIIPTSLAHVQVVLGLPAEQTQLFLRDRPNWNDKGILQTRLAESAWAFMKFTLDEADYVPLLPET